MSSKFQTKAPSQRQLKIGEMLRHSLSEAFMHADFRDPALSGCSITVSEVRISPDLKNATIYVVPLGGAAPDDFIESLNEQVPYFRKILSSKVKLRHMPRLTFRRDNSFENAYKIEEILHKNQEEDAKSSE